MTARGESRMDVIKDKYMPRDNAFYRQYYHYILYGLMGLIVLLLLAVSFVSYQMSNRPLPMFNAITPKGEKMALLSYDEPNLLSSTILQWASKAAVVSYSFDYANYQQQLNLARPYFTNDGWSDYLGSVNGLINSIIKAKLIVNGIVAGTPVIANQGPLPGRDYVWRIQIPFLVTYQSANTTSKRTFTVVMTIVRVPTSSNPQGVGIDQFVMVG